MDLSEASTTPTLEPAKTTLSQFIGRDNIQIDPSVNIGKQRREDLNSLGPALKVLVESFTGIHKEGEDVFLTAGKQTPEGTYILDQFVGAEMRLELFDGKKRKNL